MKFTSLITLFFIITINNIKCEIPDDDYYFDNGNISIGYKNKIFNNIFFNIDTTIYEYKNESRKSQEKTNNTKEENKNKEIKGFGFYNSYNFEFDLKYHFGVEFQINYYTIFTESFSFSINIPFLCFLNNPHILTTKDFFKINPINIMFTGTKSYKKIKISYGVKVKINSNKFYRISLIFYSFNKNNYYLTFSQNLKGIKLADLSVLPHLLKEEINEIFIEGKVYNKDDCKNDKEISNLKFEDVILPDNILEPLKEIVEYMKDSKKYKKMGAKLPKGMLLYGASGTGKTLLAKALSKEIKNCEFFSISAASFLHYNGIYQIREMFREARSKKAAIIFIDELEILGDRKSSIANELLILLDGFESNNDNIFVLGATNNISKIDPALLRSGRFDRKFEVKLPTEEARKKILETHTKNKKLDENVDLDKIAELTENFSGADLATLINESAFYAIKNGNHAITMKDLEDNIIKMRGTIDNPHLTENEIERIKNFNENKKMLKEVISETKIFG